MRVLIRFGLKAPIKGVPFSNEEVSLEVEDTEIGKEDWGAVQSLMKEQAKVIVKDYLDKLSSEISEGQSEVVQKLQVELAKTYGDKLEKATKEIYKLKDLLKTNGISD